MCVLPLQAVTQDRTGHKDPVRGALYNSAFAVIISVDEAGTTCVWNLQVRHWCQHCLTQQDTSGHQKIPLERLLLLWNTSKRLRRYPGCTGWQQCMHHKGN